MKNILLFTFLFASFISFAQHPLISQKTQFDVSKMIHYSAEISKGNKDLLSLYPIMNLNGYTYVSFLGKKLPGAILNSNDEVFYGVGQGDIISIRVRIDQLQSIYSLQGIANIELAGKIKANLDKVVYDTRVDSVHAGIGLPEAYTGKDVFIGITDWGFDYTSPMFYDTLLQETRVFAAWDQFKTNGPTPSSFNYGTQYTGATELIAAGADTANIYSYATHGTHVAGICGGSGAGLQYRGMAFESQYLFTTFLVDEAAVLDAWNWMYFIAQSEGKRLVVNMSWGLYHFGTNDGNSLLSQAIDNFADNGVVFASSAGNNGNVNFHIKKNFNNETIKTKVEFYDYNANEFMWGQSIHFWGEQGKDFEAKLEILNGSNVSLVNGFFIPSSLNGYLDTFIIANVSDTVWYNISAESAHPLNSRPTMRLRVKNTNLGLKVILHVKAITGTVHLWNVTELTTDVGNWGMSFSSPASGYTSGDHFYGIGEPAAANKLISVASHAASYLSGSSEFGGNRSTFSSIGPLYDGTMKPDISAPGQNVASSISSFTDNDYVLLTSVDFQGRTYPFSKFSGTSMSSPAVAGICALILDANQFLSAQQVKDIIIATARLDNFTGAIPLQGDSIWGHGKINAYHAIKLALNTIGLNEIEDSKDWKLYPNPTSSIVKIEGVDAITEICLIDLQGKQSMVTISNHSIDISSFTSGIYFVRFVSNGKVYQKKLIIQ